MSDRNQPIKVRIKGASLIGFIAKYDSLGSSDIYKNFFFAEPRSIIADACQDLHWEVRKEMCSHLFNISKYLGPQLAQDKVIPELKELIDDEEGEVVTEAIIQFQKHVDHIFSQEFINSQECIDFFKRSIQLIEDKDQSNIDLAAIFKKLGKLLLAFEHHVDKKQIKQILQYGIRA